MTIEQAEALMRLINDRKAQAVHLLPNTFDLPDGYLLVAFHDGFQCGIAPDGRVSS